MEGGLLLLWGRPGRVPSRQNPACWVEGGSTHRAAWLSGDLPQAPVCVGQRTPVSPRSQSLQGGGRAGRLGASLGGVFGNQVPTPGLCRLGAWQPLPHSGPGRYCLLLASHWAGGLWTPLPLLHLLPPASLPPPPALGPAPPHPMASGHHLCPLGSLTPSQAYEPAPPPPPTTKGRAHLSTAALAGRGSVTDGVVWSACETSPSGLCQAHVLQPDL